MPQKARTFSRKVTIGCGYLLFLPADYARSRKKWPLLLFLHGSGERGNDLNLVRKNGVPLIVEKEPDFPFVVVSPQCAENKWWSVEMLAGLLDKVEKDYRIDKNRIYVTGLSMGGYGTWELAVEYPDRFAAIAPVCGGGNPLRARRIRHLPIWVFHGAKDEVVPLAKSREMVSALRKQGSKVRLTVYPEAGHDSWTKTYQNKKLYAWFLSHQRVSAAARAKAAGR
jgi:predicted peptidase